MFDIGLSGYIIAALTIVLGFFGIYIKAQKKEIEKLGLENKIAYKNAKRLEKIAVAANKKAELHKQVAREVATQSEVTRERIKRLQEKIDAAKNAEEFTVTF